MLRNSVVFIFVAYLLPTGLSAQQSEANLSIGGTVVDSTSGEAVKRAQLTLSRVSDLEIQPGNEGLQPHPQRVYTTAFSDTAGVFRFGGLTSVVYRLTAQKPGFVLYREPSGARTIKLTASLEDVRMGLSPLGVITGKVVDQEGQPVPYVNIVALHQQIVDGRLQVQSYGGVGTDDRGTYRFWNLQPGKYFIGATGKRGGTALYAGDVPPRFTSVESFVPVYSGGGKTLEAAQPVIIEPGTQAQVDLALALEPAHKIRGSLAGYAPRTIVRFELLSGDEEVSPSRASVNGETGTFEIPDVMPGTYTLRATQGQARAERAVTVGGEDLNGVVATLFPSVDIKVHLQPTNPPPPERNGGERAYVHGWNYVCVTVTLRSPSSRAGEMTYHAHPVSGQGGDWMLSGILPGLYRFEIECNAGYLRSVTFGTQDLLANPVVTIQPGVAPQIDILATLGGGSLTGKISVESLTDADAPGIVIVPQFSASTGPTIFRSAKFHVTGLAPGSYKVYAFSNIDEVEYRNPAFIQSLTGGVTVLVQENGKADVQLTKLMQ